MFFGRKTTILQVMKKIPKDTFSDTRHTLNNLLTSVVMSAEILSRELFGKLNSKQKKYVKTILSEAKKMKKALKQSRTP